MHLRPEALTGVFYAGCTWKAWSSCDAVLHCPPQARVRTPGSFNGFSLLFFDVQLHLKGFHFWHWTILSTITFRSHFEFVASKHSGLRQLDKLENRNPVIYLFLQAAQTNYGTDINPSALFLPPEALIARTGTATLCSSKPEVSVE